MLSILHRHRPDRNALGGDGQFTRHEKQIAGGRAQPEGRGENFACRAKRQTFATARAHGETRLVGEPIGTRYYARSMARHYAEMNDE